MSTASEAVSHKETRTFQTEVRQLLDLMIHALYSNQEVFLRELISNASDACDKLRFEALADDALYEGRPELEIHLTVDKEARTLTITDSGVGMSHDEVVENIGTIAQSGTKAFLKGLSGDQQKDANLIGQFGVGFYASFIVADKVVLETRRAGLVHGEGVRWESSGEGSYTIEHAELAERGTRITLHLREGMDEFLEPWRLRNVVNKFSDHISWPILMPGKAEEPPVAEGEEPPAEQSSAPVWERVNSATALWTRPKAEITAEEYNTFYQHVGHDFQEPLAHVHAKLEGNYEFTVLLYLPSKPPFDLWDRDRRHGVKLYVRRVFIMEGSEELMPRYLRFVRGVIDSADLPLNVSREILQQDKAVAAIRRGAVGKVLGLLEELARDEPEKYAQFWTTFGVVLKEGVIEEHAQQARLAKLLRFASTHDEGSSEQKCALGDYVARMREGQEAIYYVTGESLAAARTSPHLEIFRKKGIEVLLLSDRIDEWMVEHLREFDGKRLQPVNRGALDLGKLADAEPDAAQKEADQEVSEVAKRVEEALGELVKGVRASHRLTDSPSCLVSEEFDLSPTMERLLKAAGQEAPKSRRTLELNATHPLVKRLESERDDERFKDLSHLLYEQALLSEGGQLEAPALFVARLNKLLLAMAHG